MQRPLRLRQLWGSHQISREEAAYIDQVGIARRLLEQILVLDRRLNTRLAGKDSYYNR